ncbi:hypothetical protein [Thermus scotoductus]|uniref:MFS transporter n=1 Tax=Thermus scotoductus TaxID=37636 RepID=A0A430UHC7_THESC|nr:hypothetical protein [Thermus scotoductus]RTG95558.1 hypothetical protein CSW51_06480 [Thermus scotoductus]RTH04312.1 hypothetical protein CSW47_06935 [Thermus scotoductus]RTH26216.1 hypothetical protein CSW38_06290 [Thermus scotoductus]RTI00567.1 hypothetical protein CSW29_05685 [Thermus scotoductus]RTI16804.1 hypothetical protein CSW27_03025 [Thermus scotoductus]
MRPNGSVLAEALSDLGASLGFSALALEIARTGEAFWVGLFAALGYLTLGPLLFLSPWVERRGLARTLLGLRLARGLLFLPLPFLPRQAALLALYAYPLMVLTDLAIVAWEGLLVRRDRANLAEKSGKLYAAWEVGGLVGTGLGPALFALHPALPYCLSAGILLLAWTLLRPALMGEEEGKKEEAKPESWGRALRRLLLYTPLRPYLLASLLFTLSHALTTALLGLLVLRGGTPEALFGLVFTLQSLGYTLGSYLAGRVPPALVFKLAPLGAALGGMGLLLPFPFLLATPPLLGLAVALLSTHLRAVRGWLLPREGLAPSLAVIRALLYGAGALGGLGAGVLGMGDPALPLLLGALGFLALLPLTLGPFHPKRLEVMRRKVE